MAEDTEARDGQISYPDSIQKLLKFNENPTSEPELQDLRKGAERDLFEIRYVKKDEALLNSIGKGLLKIARKLPLYDGSGETNNEILEFYLAMACTTSKRVREYLKNFGGGNWPIYEERMQGRYVPEGFDFSKLAPVEDEDGFRAFFISQGVSEEETQKWIWASRYYSRYSPPHPPENNNYYVGQCGVISSDFSSFCKRYFGLNAGIAMYGNQSYIPNQGGEVHEVNVVNDKIVIDWTARQYEDWADKPYPFVHGVSASLKILT